jgi:hypothetical protein
MHEGEKTIRERQQRWMKERDTDLAPRWNHIVVHIDVLDHDIPWLLSEIDRLRAALAAIPAPTPAREAVVAAAQTAIRAERSHSLVQFEEAMEALRAAVDALTPATATEGGESS